MGYWYKEALIMKIVRQLMNELQNYTAYILITRCTMFDTTRFSSCYYTTQINVRGTPQNALINSCHGTVPSSMAFPCI